MAWPGFLLGKEEAFDSSVGCVWNGMGACDLGLGEARPGEFRSWLNRLRKPPASASMLCHPEAPLEVWRLVCTRS